MTATADIDHDHDAPDPALDAQAAASRGALFKANPSIWLVTVIMVAASAGAMAGLELTRDDPRNTALERALRALFRP